jgi:hypothetical protein
MAELKGGGGELRGSSCSTCSLAHAAQLIELKPPVFQRVSDAFQPQYHGRMCGARVPQTAVLTCFLYTYSHFFFEGSKTPKKQQKTLRK